VNTVLNFRVPCNAEEFLSSCRTAGYSREAQLIELKFPLAIMRLRLVGSRHVGFVVTNVDTAIRFIPSTSVPPAFCRSTNCSIFNIRHITGVRSRKLRLTAVGDPPC
jgi:hypothetical protein